MHTQPGLIAGAKLILGAATATTAGLYCLKLAAPAAREKGLAALATRAAMATFGAAYMAVVLIEPLVDLALLAAAKARCGLNGSALVTPRLLNTA